MPGRTFNGTGYRYGQNAQEKDFEVASGIYTAEYWEYDSRIIHRWNRDPIVKPWESPYACFNNNPIIYVDIKGDFGSKFGARLYAAFNGGKIFQDAGGEWGVNQSYTNKDGESVIRPWIFDRAGRSQGKDLVREEKLAMVLEGIEKENRIDKYVTEGLWDRNLTDEQALKNNINIGLSTIVATPGSFVSKGSSAINASKEVNITSGVAKSAQDYEKLLKPIDEFDAVKTLFRGTTGSEKSSTVIFLTDDAAVAATYVKNGGMVMKYEITEFALKSLEMAGKLSTKTGTHGILGKVSTEFMFQGKELVNALNNISKLFQ